MVEAVRNGKLVISISSKVLLGLAIPGMSHHIATKMGIIGFMRGLTNDVANDGITARDGRIAAIYLFFDKLS